ncbi:MAG: flagellar protein FliT [Nitrospinota bacterium]
MREQLVDYGRLFSLGKELLESLRSYPGPGRLKDLVARRDAVARSLKRRAERLEAEGLLAVDRPGRAELRRALEAVLEVENQCRGLHESHLERLRAAMQDLQNARDAVQAYGARPSPSVRPSRRRVNVIG